MDQKVKLVQYLDSVRTKALVPLTASALMQWARSQDHMLEAKDLGQEGKVLVRFDSVNGKWEEAYAWAERYRNNRIRTCLEHLRACAAMLPEQEFARLFADLGKFEQKPRVSEPEMVKKEAASTVNKVVPEKPAVKAEKVVEQARVEKPKAEAPKTTVKTVPKPQSLNQRPSEGKGTQARVNQPSADVMAGLKILGL